MKIVHVITTLGVGGAERFVIDLAREQGRQGHRVSIVSVFDFDEFKTAYDFDDLNIQTAGFRGNIYQLAQLIRAASKIRAAFKRIKPDVIHSHLFFADVICSCVAPIGTPIFTTFHGQEPWWSQSTLRGFLKRNLEASLLKLRRRYSVAVSQQVARAVQVALGVSPNRLAVIENGVELSRFDSPGRFRARARAIVKVARFYPEKDHRLALDAFKLVLESVPDAKLLLVGDGPTLRDTQKYAKLLGISSHVSFMGVSRDIPSVLRSADVFFLSSRREGLPISVLEAMASGLPVVVPDTGGLSDAIQHRHSGLLYRLSDSVSLAAGLVELLMDEGLADHLSKAARSRVMAHYSMNVCAKNYIALYKIGL